MSARTKVLFLGFCAGERQLIRQWADSGEMPTARALLGRGVSGATESLPGFFVGATWESFATGVTPAKHGIYCWEQLRPGTYEQFRCYTHDNFKVPPFWDHLSRAGRRVAVLDVPLCPYSRDLNGIQLVEWGAHDAQYGFMTSPPELAREVVAKFGEHPCRGNCDADRGPADHVAFRDALIRGIERKTELTRHFLRQGGWDIFLQVFTESHCIGHQAWHIHDPTHPWHRPEEARVIGDPIKDVYRAIDRGMGEILADVGDDTIVVFLAGHGMGPKFQAQFMLERILLGLGVAAPLPVPETRDEPPPASWRERLDPVLGWGWRRLPESARKTLQPLKGNIRSWIDGPETGPRPLIDPAASRCFTVTNNFAHGGIRINLAGREPAGTVQPGPECDALCAEVTRELARIVNLDNGRPIVRRVLRTAEVYTGPYVDTLPDLLVEWTNDAPVYRIGSGRIGELHGEYRYCRSGDHHPGGMFIGAGPGIVPGRLGRTVSILDFAPTLAALLGVELPDVDGRPIVELTGAARARAGGFATA
jgi:predicted AlkP superfamily phosphohydrolase/phosphomutase